MIQEFKPYDKKPRNDLYLVGQSGYVDLRVAYASAQISGDLENVEGAFNGIDEPSSIIGKPTDIFDAHRSASELRAAAVSAGHSDKSE